MFELFVHFRRARNEENVEFPFCLHNIFCFPYAVVQGGTGNGQNVRGPVERFHLHQRSQEPQGRLRNPGADEHPATSSTFRGNLFFI